MLWNELIDMINSGKKPIVEFTRAIEDLDVGVNAGMRGIVDHVSGKGEYQDYEIKVNCENFYDFNLPLFSHDYLNKETGEYNSTAIEAGWYPKNHIISFYDSDDGDYHNIKIIEESDLYKRYKAERYPNQTYVAWLEEIASKYFSK
jgi:hypothetical protein